MTNIHQIDFAEMVKETTIETQRVIDATQSLIRHLEYHTKEILEQCKENIKICSDNSDKIFKRYDKLTIDRGLKS